MDKFTLIPAISSFSTRGNLLASITALLFPLAIPVLSCVAQGPTQAPALPAETTAGKAVTGNPVFPGWYADPEGTIFGKEYWIYATSSLDYAQQTYQNAFSSPDLVHWTKHERVIDTNIITWAKRAMWAPSIVHKDGKYFLFFSANDIKKDEEPGGIGIAVSENPGGPYKDYLGKPLLNHFYNGAQPIDQFVFKDKDGQYYLIYGGWKHCNIGKLKDDFTGFVPFENGELFKEITPKSYVEGPFMFIRNNKYYLMWSEGAWTNATYNVAYAIADSPFGPFTRIGSVITKDPAIGTGAGHHSVIHVAGNDSWYIIYHRRPPGESKGNSRVTCVDRMYFNEDGTIKPVVMTNEGVGASPIP